MRTLLIYPEFPDTFWSYKHALKFGIYEKDLHAFRPKLRPGFLLARNGYGGIMPELISDVKGL